MTISIKKLVYILTFIVFCAIAFLFIQKYTKKADILNKPAPPASFYVDASKDKIVSKLSFDDIAKKVHSFQNHSDGSNEKKEILAYVFFDPLCAYCAKLVSNMLDQSAFHIIDNVAWVPIGYLQEYSTLQAAAILGSNQPSMTMAAHAANVLVGDGQEYQINVALSKQEDIDLVVQNTKVWQDAGATKVPFIVTKDPNGKTLSIYGALEGFQMAEFLSRPQEIK